MDRLKNGWKSKVVQLSYYRSFLLLSFNQEINLVNLLSPLLIKKIATHVSSMSLVHPDVYSTWNSRHSIAV